MSSLVPFAERALEISKLFKKFESLEISWPAVLDEVAQQGIKQRLENEADRFELWTVNLGVFVPGHGSIDYRLREAQGMRETLQRLLNSLKDALDDVCEYLAQEDVEVAGDEPSEVINGDTPSLESDMDLLMSGVKDPIDALFKLSVWIRNPVTRLVSSKARHFQQIDEETDQDLFQAFESFDKDCIRSLFLQYRKNTALQGEPIVKPLLRREKQKIGECEDFVWEPIRSILSKNQHELLNDGEPFLIGRIARANGLRRRQFAYWKRHRDKLQQHTTAAILGSSRRVGVDANTGLVAFGPSSGAHAVPESVTTATRLNLPSKAIDENLTTPSVSEYTPSAWQPSKEDIRFPPPPRIQAGDTFFTCPYCFTVCPAEMLAQRAWEAHLIRDLRPYLCTYKECENPGQLYDSMKDWTQHENAMHRRIFRCPEHQEGTFATWGAYEAHIRQERCDSASHIDNQLAHLVSQSTLSEPGRCCPICSLAMETAYTMQKHIARHLIRFSLFSLPRSRGCDDEETAKSESAHAKVDSDGTREELLTNVAGSIEPPGDTYSHGSSASNEDILAESATFASNLPISWPDDYLEDSTAVGGWPVPTESIVEPGISSSTARQLKQYQIIPSRNFKSGSVFKIYWSEHRGNSLSTMTVAEESNGFYYGFRRFIVVGNALGLSICLPILSYGHQGCTKKGVDPSTHGQAYDDRSLGVPRLLDGEPLLGVGPIAIKIVKEHEHERIEQESRINYSNFVSIEHNFPVLFIGKVARKDEHILFQAAKDFFRE